MPWVDAYTPHEWKVYEIPFDSHDIPSMIPDNHFDVCFTESEHAASAWKYKSHEMFYSDFEQMAAGLDQFNHGSMGMVYRLTKPWGDHPRGALVFIILRGAEEGYRTYLIENI